ncbi:MAG: hypothetical protein D6683_18095, partial [Actinomyces sp.]
MGSTRRRRTAATLAVLLAAGIGSAPPAVAGSGPLDSLEEIPRPSLAGLVEIVVDPPPGREPLIRVVEEATPYTPFGSPVQLDTRLVDSVRPMAVVEFGLDPEGFAVPLDPDGDGTPDLGPEVWRVRSAGGSGGAGVERLSDTHATWVATNGLVPSALGTGTTGASASLVDPSGPDLFGAHFDDTGMPYAPVVGSGDLQPPPLVYWGATVAGPLPTGPDCGGTILDIAWGHALGGRPVFDPSPGAPLDLFGGTNLDIVLRCDPDQGGWLTTSFELMGGGFQQMPTATRAIVWDRGFLAATPLDEILGTTGYRLTTFVTPTANPFRPDTTAAFSDVAPPMLHTGMRPPILVGDPFPGATVRDLPLTFAFTGRDLDPACGPDTWAAGFEVFAWDDGAGGVAAGLNQFLSAQRTAGPVDGDLGRLRTSGGGPGYQETYDLSDGAGTYVYEPDGGPVCTWSVEVTDGWNQLLTALRTAFPPPTEEAGGGDGTPAVGGDSAPEATGGDEAGDAGVARDEGGATPAGVEAPGGGGGDAARLFVLFVLLALFGSAAV